ncbi:MAG: rhamnulokinase [Fimbriimonas sp.]
MARAVAVDLGASSGRFAVGTLADGRIEFEVIEQIAHQAVERNGRLEWDLEALLGLCQRASDFAATLGEPVTLGIDSWGVDHGFLDAEGNLIDPPVCYRDLSHLEAFESLAPHRERLYALTGIQHQPFNTVCQLLARRTADPTLLDRAKDWMILPDLLGYLLTGERQSELTQASTAQLMGTDGKWSAEVFDLIGWPTPERQPSTPGKLGFRVRENVTLAHVGSHDTASAVAGFGPLADDQLFLNVGTWSLVGCLLDAPMATREAELAQFTNERACDGRVRFLKNIPGFYVVNRLHEELAVGVSVPEWLATLERPESSVDLLHPELYNPESMVETIASLAAKVPESTAQWAGLALQSLTDTIARTPAELSALTGRTFSSFRVGGGGSQSPIFCQQLANASGLEVIAGPAEATVLGNLAVQFLAAGHFASYDEMLEVIGRSTDIQTYRPQ